MFLDILYAAQTGGGSGGGEEKKTEAKPQN